MSQILLMQLGLHWVEIVGAIVLGLVAVVVIVGYLLPKEHHASCSAVVAEPAEKVWDTILDVQSLPKWNRNIRDVSQLTERNGLPAWVETDQRGQSIPYETTEIIPGQRIVRRIANEKLGRRYRVQPDLSIRFQIYHGSHSDHGKLPICTSRERYRQQGQSRLTGLFGEGLERAGSCGLEMA